MKQWPYSTWIHVTLLVLSSASWTKTSWNIELTRKCKHEQIQLMVSETLDYKCCLFGLSYIWRTVSAKVGCWMIGLWQNFWKVAADPHPAVARITSRGRSLSFALDEVAALVLWAVNWLVSIPADSSPSLAHLEIVSLETPLCGCMKLTNSFLSVPLKGAVLLRYSFSVRSGQRALSAW